MIKLEADEEIGNLEEEQAAIIREIAEALERTQKDKLPALTYILDYTKEQVIRGNC